MMQTANLKRIVSAIVASALFPILANAATPSAALESAEIVAIGNKIRVLRAPTKDINGKTKYYDLNIFLGVQNTGVPEGTASVTATASPQLLAMGFIPVWSPNKCTTER